MSRSKRASGDDVLALFHPAVQDWFRSSFAGPTAAQIAGWPAIASGDSTLICAPTGSGKTLTAFLACIDRLMFSPVPAKNERCRVLYISPLKALAVDIERNLRAPLAGITNVAVARGAPHHVPTVATRTGDTPALERARFRREPADIMITTPESLYLLLTSNAREALRSVETAIVDEIHALVPTKRGAHLALSLERLEQLAGGSFQRIGLSATQRPLDEVARFLGGAERAVRPVVPEKQTKVRASAARPYTRRGNRKESASGTAVPAVESEATAESTIHDEFEAQRTVSFRTVSIVDTGESKRLSLTIEVPVEDMARLGEIVDVPSGAASQGPVRSSIWPAIHPRLVELIRQHQSTLIFVNSRRLAERLAAALNELAGETLVAAHHGSIARDQRVEIEDRLKSGQLPALVATSSLELGIDMGAIDLVVQIEAPPSVASGLQRIGRASHQVGAASEGIVVPKYRSDLVACAAVAESMLAGRIEPIRHPRNPLDVLAQQIVAMVAVEDLHVDELFDTIRCAAPFAELSRTIFEGVLDMLSGVYPSDEFAELRPRVTWDRISNRITARPGSRRVAIVNGGTIPDRGLYGVFLSGTEGRSVRVGELDEEMVFESRVGETFLLGASTWRIESITHDRILVSPAPGEPGKMPFWHGESAERHPELGRAIGALIRETGSMPRAAAVERLLRRNALDARAAENFIQYLEDQKAAIPTLPDDRTVVIERTRDELGDWRLCLLSPFGGRILSPWAMAVIANVREELGIEVEAMWSDDGFVIRFPETDEPPDVRLLLPESERLEHLVVRQLGSSALFAAKFREAAARALLLPKHRPGTRAPLWQQRKRAADLLQVASRFGSFPMLLEAYRECIRDVFDIPSLVGLLRSIEQRATRVVTADTEQPSPFAGSILFRYVANYIYDGDAPLAERRAQALALDQAQLRELLGEAELRELLETAVLEEHESQLQRLAPEYRARTADGIHDLLLGLGDLTREEIAARYAGDDAAEAIGTLLRTRRVIELPVNGELRLIPAEDSARYRDALGIPLPAGIPDRFLRPVADAVGDLVSRFARTHGPFTPDQVSQRLGLGRAVVETELKKLVTRGRLVEGEFRPRGVQREWCDRDVLRVLRLRSLSRLRKQVEPVETAAFARLLLTWQGVIKRAKGLDALLDVIENLQGYPLPASIFENEILANRLSDYAPSDLDTLVAAGEVIWTGVEPLGENDGRIALYLTDKLPLLIRDPVEDAPLDALQSRVVTLLEQRGASFFAAIQQEVGGFPAELVDALWSLVWRGIVTNDTVHALRAYTRSGKARTSRPRGARFRSRRTAPPAAEGRWSLVRSIRGNATATERLHATAQQLLSRYGVVVREAIAGELLRGGFSAVYDVYKQLEESGRIRRGYFVQGLAATQFAVPAAVDLLRTLRIADDDPEVVLLAATDPANPYGSIVRWPAAEEGRGPTRSVGAAVILVDGLLAASMSRGEKQLLTFLPDEEPRRSRIAAAVAEKLASLVAGGARRALLVQEIDGRGVSEHPLEPYLRDAGFHPTGHGYLIRATAAHA